MVEGTPPGDALPPPPQRATPARKGARCGAGAGSPRPHGPHPGHTGRRTPGARPRGRAAGRGTAPDTRRPSQRWQATPPGDGSPPPPRHAAPTGHAGQGDSVGPPHQHARDHSMWVADPNSPPGGRAVWGGGAPDHRRPSQRWKAPPRERPSATRTASNAGLQGRTLWGRCWVPRPHRPHPGHTGRGTPAARPRGRAAAGGTAPDTGRPSQQWQATRPGDGLPLPPRHAAPTGHAGQVDSVGPPHPHTRAHSTWVADPNSPPSGQAVGGGGAPDLRRPSQRWKAPPPGDALLPPPQRATPAHKGARCGTGAGSPHQHRPHPEHTGCGTPAARPRGRAVGGGTAPDTRRPSQQWQANPPRGQPPTTPAARSPHRACRPSQVVGNRDRTAPPHARQTEQGTGAGHAEGHAPRGTALPALSSGTARGAHATPPRGGGERTPRERERTHAQRARGDYQRGEPDQARGTHRPRGMAYQRARVRDTRMGRPATSSAGHAGREGGNGRDTTPGTVPSPPNRPRAARTHGRGTAPAKAVVAHCATPQPLG